MRVVASKTAEVRGIPARPTNALAPKRSIATPTLPGILQPKLVIGAVNDPLEREADRIADQVMRMPASIGTITPSSPQLSRRCAACEQEEKEEKEEKDEKDTLRRARAAASSGADERDVPGIVHDVLGTPGRPLDAHVRSDMEQRFAHDFSKVRVHTDTAANASAGAVNARAYTVAHHLVFGGGQFAPATTEGRTLIAHELAHVVQQGKAGSILRRQPCDRTKETIVTGPLPVRVPAITCNPTGKPLADVRADPAATPTAMGATESVETTDKITTTESKGSKCNAVVQPADLAIRTLIFAKEGTWDDGTEVTPPGRVCPKGQVLPRRAKITQDGAKKLREGEIEHCEDKKLAFGMSWGKFNQATKDLAGDYCASGVTPTPAGTICDKEFATRFKNRTGVEFDKRKDVADCLLAKTGLRDTNLWHNVVPTDFFYSPGCKMVTYLITPDAVPEVGRHPASGFVKGCGEK